MRYSVLIVAVFLGIIGCAGLVSNEPIPIDPVDAKYIEAETAIKNAYKSLAGLGSAELKAREEGKPKGSVITKEHYDRGLVRLDDLTRAVRYGRNLIGEGSCVTMDQFKNLNMKGCLNREQIALFALNILEREVQ